MSASKPPRAIIRHRRWFNRSSSIAVGLEQLNDGVGNHARVRALHLGSPNDTDEIGLSESSDIVSKY